MNLREIILIIQGQHGPVLRWNGVSTKLYEFVKDDARNIHTRVYTEHPEKEHHSPLEQFKVDMPDIFGVPHLTIWGGIFVEFVSEEEYQAREAALQQEKEQRAREAEELQREQDRLMQEAEESERAVARFLNNPQLPEDDDEGEEAEEVITPIIPPKAPAPIAPKNRQQPPRRTRPGSAAGKAKETAGTASAPGIAALEEAMGAKIE